MISCRSLDREADTVRARSGAYLGEARRLCQAAELQQVQICQLQAAGEEPIANTLWPESGLYGWWGNMCVSVCGTLIQRRCTFHCMLNITLLVLDHRPASRRG